MEAFEAWESFYIIVGAAAAALIGLQFIVMTLMAQKPATYASETGAAFVSSTIVHFCSVLLISALQRAPWPSPLLAILVMGSVGACGVVYTLLTAWRMYRQTSYVTEFEDWLFHALLPLASYLLLALSAVAFTHVESTLFAIATFSLLLLFTAVHNAWDTIEYQITTNLRERAPEQPPSKPHQKH